MSSWSSHGPNKTVLGAGLFSDLSFCWYSVKFSISSRTDPNDTRAVTRSAQYLPPPKALDRDALLLAHETYGDTVAAFAESFEGTDQYCARGECWDLASEALKYFDEFDYIPKPLPSTSCTHGHLIFSGKASSSSQQVGFWRGGDDRIRRGDILQWKNGKIGMGPRGHATLGNPDHTAVIVTDSVPLAPVADGASVKPSVLGIIEVVEQSVGSPPKREKYDLSQLQVGELWIYRPIGIVTYLGTTLEIECPPHVGAMSI